MTDHQSNSQETTHSASSHLQKTDRSSRHPMEDMESRDLDTKVCVHMRVCVHVHVSVLNSIPIWIYEIWRALFPFSFFFFQWSPSAFSMSLFNSLLQKNNLGS